MTSSRLAAALWLMAAGIASGSELHLYESVEPHMGTLFRIKLYAETEERARAAFRGAFDRIAALDEALSDYREDSELNRVCRASAGESSTVSPDLYAVLAFSQELAEATGGAFDVTLGPVNRLWREARRSNRIPGEEVLREALARTGFRKLHLDAQSRSVRLDETAMLLDLGGVAKGYAADAALEVLERMGVRSALVAASGDLRFGDPPPAKRGWRIAVGSPDRVLELRNAAVSTSGDSEQHLDFAGTRYSHIVDPASGRGLIGSIAVTVVAPRGIESDALATAVSVLGVERGLKLIEGRRGTAALITLKGRTVQSANWPESIHRPGD